MEFSRQEHWSGLPFPSPENLPNPGIELGSPTLQADSLPTESLGKMPFFYDLKATLLFILFGDKEERKSWSLLVLKSDIDVKFSFKFSFFFSCEEKKKAN